MSSDIDVLRELFSNSALVPFTKNVYGKTEVVLEEPSDATHDGYSVTISNVPDETIVIKTDRFPSPKTIFKPDKGTCKRADFVIIAYTDKDNWIIYIELKKGKGNSEKEIIQQLQGSQCLIAYCREIGQTFWQRSDFLKLEKYKHCFVSIRGIGINKKPTSESPHSGSHNCPENMLKINSPKYLQFKSLILK